MQFVVFRLGKPAENQGLAEKPVLRVEARDAHEACRIAAQQVRLAPGQSLAAKPANELDEAEGKINLRAV